MGEKDSKTRNNEVMELLDFGYSNLKVTTLKKKNEVVKKIKLDKADSEIVDIVLKKDLNITQSIDDELGNYKYKININDFKLPVKEGDIVGSIEVYDNNIKLKEEGLTVNKNIRSLGFIKLFTNELIDLISGEF